MKTIRILWLLATSLIILLLALGIGRSQQAQESPSLDRKGQLLELLPQGTLLSGEVRDLAQRWPELRGLPGLARVQDLALAELGLSPEQVPSLLGSYAVFAWVSDEATGELVPLVLLEPDSRGEVRTILDGAAGLAVRQDRGAIWVARQGQAQSLETIAAGDGTSLAHLHDQPGLEAWLPRGGLVRAFLHPRAIARTLRARAEKETLSLTRGVLSLLAADMEVVTTLAFRRDIVDGTVVTDGWIGLDTQALPQTLVRELTGTRAIAAIPEIPDGEMLAAVSFPAMPRARLDYLLALGAQDSMGPLRNLDFWVEEFNERFDRDLQADLSRCVGERGLSLLLKRAEDSASVDSVLLLDARDRDGLQRLADDLATWSAKHAQSRWLGLVAIGSSSQEQTTGAVRKLSVRTPLGRLEGPAYRLTDDHLVLATSLSALDRGAHISRQISSSVFPDTSADGLLIVNSQALSGIIDAAGHREGFASPLVSAAMDLLAQAGPARLETRMTPEGVQLHGELALER